MRTVRRLRPDPTVVAFLAIGPGFQCLVLGSVAGLVGLSSAGWLAGLGCAATVDSLLRRGLTRSGSLILGPANRVTLIRAGIVGAIAALIVETGADPATRPGALAVLLFLAVLAQILDAVDGQVARRTGTVTPLGARFDMEVDAFLIFLLSVAVSRSVGWWVLAIGLARYGYVAAGWVLPWLQRVVPARYWRKTVAAVQAITLTVAVSGLLSASVVTGAVLIALALLAESFGRDVWWQWRQRTWQDVGQPHRYPTIGLDPRWRPAARHTATVLALVLVWFALVSPVQLSRLQLAAFLRIPAEGLVLTALALWLRPRARRAVSVLAGLLLGVLATVKVCDLAVYAFFDRAFNPITDWGNLPPALSSLGDSFGRPVAVGAAVAAVVLVLILLLGMVAACWRLGALIARHPRPVRRVALASTAVWMACALTGVQIVRDAPLASTSATGLVADQVSAVRVGLSDRRAFAEAVANDSYRSRTGDQLLNGLRGKDVVIAFVESYGRVAVQGSELSSGVDRVLRAGTASLQRAGFGARSAFLTSPTFGGISWLAHSSLQSGLWIDNQQRYNELVGGNRFTLSDAFARAGWRTVGDVPSNQQDWPQARSFYHYDALYDARNVGYRGPGFSYATMPDQYILSAFARNELALQDRPAVMAEIDLVSSHEPWAPLPRLVPWDRIGDGSVFTGMPQQGPSRTAVWRSAGGVRQAYGRSIEYSLASLVQFVENVHDDNLVLLLLGDHQPATIVSGSGASHDVPITVVAHDPAVLERIHSWGWQSGLLPDPSAPVWRMDSFRDRFLAAYAR
ncbi:CDP-alcohol phosphatidyltransferase family protein [Jatrophihabitans telluris]|uniref:CDP-alcohol phosphatidyltransferase family protein n=1 Tax=Jatrophihabitans telluris TaxID=2038343 RepID=A0ABY4R2Y7_9ACTN|nr:CDP-alcohol phosphatidyltransferase family protein [Jatrophihabitans telluris]UQX89394.1 CDP-alcohol phosphatidyltransferase family protein [Jatrophihabitans telluris]